MRRPLILVVAALVALFVAAAPASAEKHGKEPEGFVSQLSDDRIVESSGLALSVRYGDLVYTMNDSGNHPMVYAIQLSTGRVVGTTDISSLHVKDTESIAVDAHGTMWLGDLGDNDHRRDDVAIYAFPEPGPGNHNVGPVDRYRVAYPDGPVNVEGMLVNPQTDQVHLVSKNESDFGTIYELPPLTPSATVTAKDLHIDAPRAVTDATFTHDGRWALLRTNYDVWMYNPKTWQPVSWIKTPRLQQGESIAVEPGDRTMLLGSEGKDSPIIRVPLPNKPADAPPIRLNRSGGVAQPLPVELAVAAVLLVAVVVIGRRILVARDRSSVRL
jgi:hypothetical protein